MELLTSSRLKSFCACQRQHALQYVQGYRPVAESPALAFGTAIHAALECWWTTRDLDAALARLPTLEPYDAARAEMMLVGYDAAYRNAGLETLAVEVEFRLPLVNPATGAPSRTWQLAGKLDAVVRAPDGRVFVLEHKTTSEQAGPGSAYRRRLALDGQVSQYVEGAAALGFDAAGVLYDVLSKPAQRPLEANTRRSEPESVDAYRERVGAAIAAEPARYFQHVEVVRLDDERRDYGFDVWQLARAMREGAAAGIAPRNPDACFRYGSACAFFDVCTGVASLDDSTRFRRATRANEELAAA